MQLIPIIVSIIVITIVISQKKKKRAKRKTSPQGNIPITAQSSDREAYFEDRIKYMIDSYASKPSLFEDYYNEYMASKISKEKDQLLDMLPTVKEKYKIALHKLADISKGNTVFFTTKEEQDSIHILERNKKMSDDIIKTLPLLADFVEIQHTMSEIEAYVDEIATHDEALWGGISYLNYEDETSESLREYQKHQYDAACGSLRRGYDCFIKKKGWQIMCEIHPEFNTEGNKLLFETVAEKDTCLVAWIRVWLDQFQAISKKNPRSLAFIETIDFLKDLEKEIGSPAWFSRSSGIIFGSYSAFPICFDLKNYTKADLMELRDLYINGKMTGRYHKTNDPRYSDNEN